MKISLSRVIWRQFLAIMLPFIAVLSVDAQIIKDAIKWEMQHSNTASGEVTIKFNATLKPGWHVYDTDMPEDGPTPTTIELYDSKGVTMIEKLTPSHKPDEVYDPNFEMTLSWFSNSVTFTQKFQIEDPNDFLIAGDLVHMVCNNTACLPPDRFEFSISPKDLKTPLTIKATTPSEANTNKEEVRAIPLTPIEPATNSNEATNIAVATETESLPTDLFTPVVDELKAYGDGSLTATDSSTWMIFLLGFAGGLVALLTPCVWPMIPMTVSFFLKRTKNRQAAVRDALLYASAIIIIYLSLGLLITGVFGASALNSLATDPIFNILFFLLLVVFAISFFGGFELVLPQSWTNKMDAKAESTGGLLSIFFMAFTLALVSFSCTGPIIGTLLVEAATKGSMFGPAVGMFGFSLALAIPFALFAIFPNFLQSMPKSGGWLNSVKVVLGFLELALAFKFLSVADLASGWGLLNRDLFIAIWIVIFLLLGFYLLGKLRLPHDAETNVTSVTRLFLAMVSLSFAIWMIPGLWGAPLKAISAFTPPLYTQDLNLYDGSVHPQHMDYESGMAQAKRTGKPVLIDFSGYGCVNCREMEASVWTDPTVKGIIDNEFILITLIVDDKTRLPETVEVDDFGTMRKLRTIGDKWSYFQRTKFGSNSQPFYVMLDPDGMPIGPSYGFNKDTNAYIKWLRGGLREYTERKSNKE